MHFAGVKVIESDATQIKEPGHGFRRWQYATIQVTLWENGTLEPICVDSGCTMTLVDRKFLLEQLPEIQIQKTTESVTVRCIGSKTFAVNEFFTFSIYIPGSTAEGPAIARLQREAHVVDDLRAKMLFGVDILAPERMHLNFVNRTMTIGSCGELTVKMVLTPRPGTRTRRVVLNKEERVIPAHSLLHLPTELRGSTPLPSDRDLTFRPIESSTSLRVYGHIVDYYMSFV